MHASIDRELSRQHSEEIRHEVAANRLAVMARANRERRPYMVRDLSWELARYLDAETVSESASATTPNLSISESTPESISESAPL